MNDFTAILDKAGQGDLKAAQELLPLVYGELRELARRKLANETAGQTLDATALVHEAYLRLAADTEGAGEKPSWKNRGHFLAAAAEAMRRILIDNARRKKSSRRGGDHKRVMLVDVPAASHPPENLFALDEALKKLAVEDEEAAAVVKLRFYAGRSVEEAGEALGMSRSQAYRHWTYACTWLRSELGKENSADP